MIGRVWVTFFLLLTVGCSESPSGLVLPALQNGWTEEQMASKESACVGTAKQEKYPGMSAEFSETVAKGYCACVFKYITTTVPLEVFEKTMDSLVADITRRGGVGDGCFRDAEASAHAQAVSELKAIRQEAPKAAASQDVVASSIIEPVRGVSVLSLEIVEFLEEDARNSIRKGTDRKKVSGTISSVNRNAKKVSGTISDV